MKISAVFITRNEEGKLARALDSVTSVADEIVVVDSGSSDDTAKIARAHTQLVFSEPWRGYREQKQLATDRASHDWVLNLDADECLSPELQVEITAWKAQLEPGAAGYRIPRLSRFLGRWIRHTTWYPDYQLRLFNRKRGGWQGGRVHESFRVEGPVGTFRQPILHFSYSDISEYLKQLDNFSALAAGDLFDRGQRASLFQLMASPALVFFKNLVLRRGFLDGTAGVAVSGMAAASTFFKLLNLLELQRHGRHSESKDF